MSAKGNPVILADRSPISRPAPDDDLVGVGSLPAPLVSVVVATFQSAATIVETLESIREQDHDPIELIVCDDASRDETVAIVSAWLARNAPRFSQARLLTSQVNLGVCRNVGRGMAEASGQWIKAIAGDDLLLPGALSAYMQTARGSDCAAVVARVHCFDSVEGQRRWGQVLPETEQLASLAAPGPQLQKQLAMANPVPAPGVLMRRSAFIALGGYDTDFTHLEDWPTWMRMAEQGLRFATIERPLVGYRVGADSISARRSACDVNPHYLRDLVTFYRKHQRRHLPLWRKLDRWLEVSRWELAAGPLRGHPRLYRATAACMLLSPVRWRLWLRGR